MRGAISIAAVGALVACATPTYNPPMPSAAEVAAAEARVGSLKLETHDRSDEERSQLLARVEARIREAAAMLCPEVADGDCSFNVRLAKEEEPNAYVDGSGNVTVTESLLEYLGTEDEVAMVLAHEFAHRMSDHAAEAEQNIAVGATIGAVLLGGLFAAGGAGAGITTDAARLGLDAGSGIGHISYSKAQEREADYIGSYLVALAGYDLDKAGRVMDNLAAMERERDGSISTVQDSFFSTHPSSPERAASLARILAEIAGKRASGAALVPEARPENAE